MSLVVCQYFYYRYANLASKAERMANYKLAEELWLKAGEYVFCDVDIEWTSRRIAFCRRQSLRNDIS
ncbi:TPA: ANR family transcriptional regulator [Escherichia coli]|uniref:ANR family transcriptional regulator n=1 Tax=Escherichia coli TaxID=562 RepID=UPI00388DD811|nr:ANR family transcriptional regulator [Escherichia coli]HCB2839987.1 ANR family transcriptional regulator [Escherichia coli]